MVSFSPFSASSLPVMDLKKLTFSDQYMSSSKNKLVSRFGLGIMLSFIVFSVVLCNFSFKGPFFNGFSGIVSTSNSSILSWPFSSEVSNSSSNDTSLVKKFDNSVGINEPLKPTVAGGSNTTLDVVDLAGKNVTEKSNHDGLFVGEASIGAKTGEGNVSWVNNNTVSVGEKTDEGIVSLTKNSTVSVGVEGNETRLENVGVVDHVKNETVVVEENGDGRNVTGEDGNVGTGGDNGDLGFQGILEFNAKKSFYECDIYHGEWVRDDTKPYYPASSCPFIDRDFDCHLNGRPDSEYVKWRWQPYDCDIPRLNTTDFLERLRGKKLVFVGDSLNRNMWESLVCALRHGVADKTRVYEISGRHEFKKKGFYAFLFEDYNCTIDFVSSPFLVKQSTYKSKNGSLETLRLDLMDGTTSMYHDADVIIFNTGHWWTHEKTSRGEDYYQEGNYVHPRLKVLEAYARALATWGRWVDKNIDQKRTHVIFRGYSVTHFRGGPWNSGGQCHKETEPIFNQTYLAKYPSKMKILEYVMKDMKTPVMYLNISRLTDYRKDAHPSIYRPDYQAAQQEVHAQDCSHWCLPGVPDTWNHLLYVSLLKSGLGSWKD